MNTSDYHEVKQKKERKIAQEITAYLNGDKKIPIPQKKEKEWNYKKALKRTQNPKFIKGMKKFVSKLIKNNDLMTKEKYNEEIKKMKKKKIQSNGNNNGSRF